MAEQAPYKFEFNSFSNNEGTGHPGSIVIGFTLTPMSLQTPTTFPTKTFKLTCLKPYSVELNLRQSWQLLMDEKTQAYTHKTWIGQFRNLYETYEVNSNILDPKHF